MHRWATFLLCFFVINVANATEQSKRRLLGQIKGLSGPVKGVRATKKVANTKKGKGVKVKNVKKKKEENSKKQKMEKLKKSKKKSKSKKNSKKGDTCGGIIPKVATKVFAKLDDYNIFYNDHFEDICCLASGLRSTLGFTWTDMVDNFDVSQGICPYAYATDPELLSDTAKTNNETMAGFDLESMDMDVLKELNEAIVSSFPIVPEDFYADMQQMEDLIKQYVAMARQDMSADVSASPLLDTVECLTTKDDAGAPSYDKAPFCGMMKDLSGLNFLFVASPVILDACYCHYVEELGCGSSSCVAREPTVMLPTPSLNILSFLSSCIAASPQSCTGYCMLQDTPQISGVMDICALADTAFRDAMGKVTPEVDFDFDVGGTTGQPTKAPVIPPTATPAQPTNAPDMDDEDTTKNDADGTIVTDEILFEISNDEPCTYGGSQENCP